MIDTLEIYTDGACRGNGKGSNLGAWAYSLFYKGRQKYRACSIPNTTNNQMELMAAIEALRALKPAAQSHHITVYSDSQYMVMGITSWIKGWVARGWTNVKNVDLWQALLQETCKFPHLSFIHVRGHADNLGNNLVDKLCNQVMDSYPKGGEISSEDPT